jgi:hypothetical protein
MYRMCILRDRVFSADDGHYSDDTDYACEVSPDNTPRDFLLGELERRAIIYPRGNHTRVPPAHSIPRGIRGNGPTWSNRKLIRPEYIRAAYISCVRCPRGDYSPGKGSRSGRNSLRW